MKTDKGFKSNLAELGERIYQLRIFKKFTPKEIASKLNLSAVAYRNIEKGNCDPSYTKLLHLAEIFQIDISELVKETQAIHTASELKVFSAHKHEMPVRKNIDKHKLLQ